MAQNLSGWRLQPAQCQRNEPTNRRFRRKTARGCESVETERRELAWLDVISYRAGRGSVGEQALQ